MAASETCDVFALTGVDELFDGDIGSFVRRRDELTKQFKKDGDRVAAAAVKQVRKPSAAAWAINQVARAAPQQIAELLEAGAAVRAAQARAVQGKDDGALRTTARDRRAIVQWLADEVARVAGPQYRDDAASTFEAASLDDQSATLVRAGRLTTTLSPAGFGLLGMPDPPDRAADSTESSEVSDGPVVGDHLAAEFATAERDRRRQELAVKEAEVEKALHRLRRAEQRLAQAQQAVVEALDAHAKLKAARDVVAEGLGA